MRPLSSATFQLVNRLQAVHELHRLLAHVPVPPQRGFSFSLFCNYARRRMNGWMTAPIDTDDCRRRVTWSQCQRHGTAEQDKNTPQSGRLWTETAVN